MKVSDAPQLDNMKPTITSQMMMYKQNIKKAGLDEIISSMEHDPPANEVSDALPLPNYMKPTVSSQMMKHKQTSKKGKRFLKKSNLPDINPSKTCSSILKESRFPKQWKDASVQHVCRYTHCSLNGKDHSTVQNSFSFLKSKANKHFSSKEFYFFEKSGSCLEKQKINRENEGSVAVSSTSEIIVHTKKPSDDYFVEIYANRNGKIETFSVNEKSGSLDLESNLIVNSKDRGDKVTNTCLLRTKSINSIDQGTEYSDELKLSVENAKSKKEVPKCKENGFTISEINNREDIEETRRDTSPKIVKDIVDKHVEKEVLIIDFSMHGDSKLPDDALIPANIPVENSNTFISRILPIDIVDSSNISCDVGIIEENETVKNKDGPSRTFISRILPADIINSSNISYEVGIIEENKRVKNKGDVKCSSENKTEDFKPNIPANNPDPSNVSCKEGIIEENGGVKNKDRCILGDIKYLNENMIGDFKTNFQAKNPDESSKIYMRRILPIENPSSISCGVGKIEENEAVKNNENNTQHAENELAERKYQHFEYETIRNMTEGNDEMENEVEDPKSFEKVKTSDKEISEEYDSEVELKSQAISLYDEKQGEDTTKLKSEVCHEGAQCSKLSNDVFMMNLLNDQVTRELMCKPHEETMNTDSKSLLYDREGKSKSGSSSLYNDDGVEFEQLLHDICSLYSNVSEQRGETVEENSNGHHDSSDILHETGIQLDMKEEYLTTVFKHLTGIATRSDQSLPDTIRKIREAVNTQKTEFNEAMYKLNRTSSNLHPRKHDPEAEKLELRHQEMDERKKADTWMLDCALRRIIANLSTCRKKKVSLLVEAFESVSPAPLPL